MAVAVKLPINAVAITRIRRARQRFVDDVDRAIRRLADAMTRDPDAR
jgi:hypothetical protein